MNFVEIPILEAAARCGIAVNDNSRSAEVEATCPFCNDRRKHLSLNMLKNQFRCNRCNASGNSITLYARLHHVDNRTAYHELTEGTGMDFFRYTRNVFPQAQGFDMKPLADRHDVYYDMLQMLDLSQMHRQQLMDRGLGRDVIERNMYRSVPEADTQIYRRMLSRLSKEHDLSGIPGFYLKDRAWRMVNKSGLLIPVCDCHGYIQGLQIRLDNTANRKYRWFSSNHYEGGTKAEPFIHVANWNQSKTAYITEGALKAEAASYLMDNVCIIGLAGVNCTNGLPWLLKRMGVTKVIEAFDMDKRTNPCVSEAVLVLKSEMLRNGVKYRSAVWNPEYKGIDDFYLALQNNRMALAA